MTQQELDDAITAAVDAVESHCVPTKMSKSGAIEFLEDVIQRLRYSIEALEDEIENERGEST